MKEIEVVKVNGVEMSEVELDRALASAPQVAIRDAVGGLREDTVSMAWRSVLNEKLVAKVQATQRRRRFTWIVSPALGLGLAGAIAAALLVNSPATKEYRSPAYTPQIEESLVATYQDAMRYTDITGVGLNPDEAVSRRSPQVQYDLVDFEIGSL
jgi:hypothetical protein